MNREITTRPRLARAAKYSQNHFHIKTFECHNKRFTLKFQFFIDIRLCYRIMLMCLICVISPERRSSIISNFICTCGHAIRSTHRLVYCYQWEIVSRRIDSSQSPKIAQTEFNLRGEAWMDMEAFES